MGGALSMVALRFSIFVHIAQFLQSNFVQNYILQLSQKYGRMVVSKEREEPHMTKYLIFDMDGTIANLYGVNDWLNKLRAYDVSPYEDAEPMCDMIMLTDVLRILRKFHYKIIIVSWLSKDSIKEYDSAVRMAKLNWLHRYGFEYDEAHFVKYGTTKANCTRHLGGNQILIDDNAKVRRGWTLGNTIDANKNIIAELMKLAIEEVTMKEKRYEAY